MESIEKPVVVEYEAFDESAPGVQGLSAIEMKDWPADPWPKVGVDMGDGPDRTVRSFWVKEGEGFRQATDEELFEAVMDIPVPSAPIKWEKEAVPTTEIAMYNTTWRTGPPKKLKALPEMTVGVPLPITHADFEFLPKRLPEYGSNSLPPEEPVAAPIIVEIAP